MNLYDTNIIFKCLQFENEDEWKAHRIKGIGGSDAASFVGLNKYKSNVQLWREKQGLDKSNISNAATQYGKLAEEHLRYLFQLKHPELDVQYLPNCTLQNKKVPYRLYSPDGLIFDKKTGKKGIYECKTTLIQNKKMYEEWIAKVPQNYYIQVLHGLLVTALDFVVINAELRFAWNKNTEIVEHYILFDDVLSDLRILSQKEDEQWPYFEKDIRPPLL